MLPYKHYWDKANQMMQKKSVLAKYPSSQKQVISLLCHMKMFMYQYVQENKVMNTEGVSNLLS